MEIACADCGCIVDKGVIVARCDNPECCCRDLPVRQRPDSIDLQDPCPGAPAIATTMGPTRRSHLDGGFDTSDEWDEIAPGVGMAAAIAGEPTTGPVLVFLDCIGDVNGAGN